MLRKIALVKNEFIKEKKLPRFNQFRIKVVIRNSASNNSPKIQTVIDRALIEIADSIS